MSMSREPKSFEEQQQAMNEAVRLLISHPDWRLLPEQKAILRETMQEVIELKAFHKLDANNLTASAIEDSWLGGQLHVLTALLHDAEVHPQPQN